MPGRGKTPSSGKTSHLFGSRKTDQRAPPTHERIAADIEAFRKGGGKIEVLGVTRSLLRIGEQPGDPAPALPAKSTPSTQRRR